jgi:hypothetical protein
LGWFKRGRVLENKGEEKKMRHGVFRKEEESWKYLQ